MARSILLAASLILGTLVSPAQVTVELEFGKDFYITDEPMLAEVRITNFSGRPLTFGEDDHWLLFSVEMRNGFLVDRQGQPSVSGVFTVPNASVGIRRVDLSPHFRMNVSGPYHVIASVRTEALGDALQSEPRVVHVTKGATIWQREFGVPGPEPDVRVYRLIRALNNDRTELYVRVASRDDSRVFTVFSVGDLVSSGTPEAQVDRHNRLHFLQQYGPRSFRYIVVTPDGELVIRQRHDYTRTRPKLVPDALLGIRVGGGIRIPRSDDLPPSSRIPAQEKLPAVEETVLDRPDEGQTADESPLPGKTE